MTKSVIDFTFVFSTGENSSAVPDVDSNLVLALHFLKTFSLGQQRDAIEPSTARAENFSLRICR